jgi:hypothetical protein
MTFTNFWFPRPNRAPHGPHDRIVMSSRVRLARNSGRGVSRLGQKSRSA